MEHFAVGLCHDCRVAIAVRLKWLEDDVLANNRMPSVLIDQSLPFHFDNCAVKDHQEAVVLHVLFKNHVVGLVLTH